MAEREAQFRHDQGARGEGRATMGVVCALVISTLSLGTSAYALYLGQATAATAIGSITIAALATVFVSGTKIHADAERHKIQAHQARNEQLERLAKAAEQLKS